MRLRSATVHHVGGAARARNARQRWTDRRGLLLALEADGALGLGEASPLPGYSPDSLEQAGRELGAVVESIHTAPGDPDAIAALAAPLASPAARFALETALLDLAARAQGRPLHRLLRAGAPPPVARSGLLQETAPRALEAEARARRAEGLAHLKLKVGAAPVDEDVERVRGLRAALGAGVSLRLDANGAWGPDEAAAALARLAPLGVDFVEEPVAPQAMPSLGRLPVRWAADESLALDADAMLEREACEILVLKPAVLGWLGAWRLGQRGIARGKQVVVTHLFDGPVALAAACELALALAGPAVLACGLDRHGGLGAFPDWRVAQLDRPGQIAASDRPGLGLGEAAP